MRTWRATRTISWSDALAELPDVTVAGKLEIESWLTPRPSLRDLDSVDPRLYREFLDTGGCEVISARLREFVKERVLPLRPLFVGVDHSLTGGVLEALASEGARPALVVLDSHFDAVPTSVRKAAVESSAGSGEAELEPPESYNCGTWLAGAIEEGLVSAEDVVVIGPSDHPGYEATAGETEGMAAYRRVLSLIREPWGEGDTQEEAP